MAGGHRRKQRFAVGPALLVLAIVTGGCAAPGEVTAPPADLRFADEPPISLDVEHVQAAPAQGAAKTALEGADADGYAMFTEALGASPEAVVRQWAEDRLRAAGRSGAARFAVVDASVREDKLPRAKVLDRLFGNGAGARYTMTVEGRLEIVAADGQRAMASARVVRTKSLEGNRTRDERQRFWTELAETTMAEFDSQMERAIRQHLNPWVL